MKIIFKDILLFVMWIAFLYTANIASAQNGVYTKNDAAKMHSLESDKKGYLIGYKIIDGDTVYVDDIRPAYIFNRPANWKKSKTWRDYYRTVYNFKKVYPYALLAKTIIHEADSVLANSKFTGRQRDKYIKKYEKAKLS